MEIPSIHYNEKTQNWDCHSIFNSNSLQQQSIKREKLSFITYNVWCDNHNFQERCKELIKLFKQYNPDIICLQEVSDKFNDFLCEDKDFIK